jgi:hypothetical protein
MCASPSDFFRGRTPPPRVAILPDSVFFSRAIPIPAGATRADVVAQVGVALESLSPFPLAQLYFGYYWPVGADRALAYASYRRRFTVEQLAEWAGAEHVLPAFAAVLGCEVAPATTLVLSSESGLTAVHWERGPVPSVVLHKVLAPEAPEEERAAARSALIRSAGESARVIDVASAPAPVSGGSKNELVFESGGMRSVLPADVAAALDVRDRADLDALVSDRRRGMILWRTAIGALAACLIFGLMELGLLGAGLWEKARIAKLAAQKPTVTHIMEEQELAGRIEELSTKRLLPLEMISVVSPAVVTPKDPVGIQFIRATASALDTIQIEAQTNNAGEIPGYKTALEKAPGVDRVEITGQRARDNIVSFTLIITFKPGALTPAAS